MILCTHCGRQNAGGARFCTACGSRLDGEESCALARLISLAEGGTRYLVADVARIIGRDPVADILVDDPEMSGRHARILFQEQAFFIDNLGGTNGTFVNGQPVQQRILRHDDVLKLGRTFLRLEL